MATIENLQTVGRNGMHRYNNQDHSMLTGLFAVRNLFGASHDLWQVNTERSYAGEVVAADDAATPHPRRRERAGATADCARRSPRQHVGERARISCNFI